MALDEPGAGAPAQPTGSQTLSNLRLGLHDAHWNVTSADCESCSSFMTFTDIPLAPGTYTVQVTVQEK